MPKPLHQRLRELIPAELKRRVPESVKDKLRPPAWRKQPTTFSSPAWSMEGTELRYVWGDPGILSRDFTVTQDAKGKDTAPVKFLAGTQGIMTAVGPTFVVLEFGQAPHTEAYRVDKDAVLNAKPIGERKFGVLVTVEELVT